MGIIAQILTQNGKNETCFGTFRFRYCKMDIARRATNSDIYLTFISNHENKKSR